MPEKVFWQRTQLKSGTVCTVLLGTQFYAFQIQNQKRFLGKAAWGVNSQAGSPDLSLRQRGDYLTPHAAIPRNRFSFWKWKLYNCVPSNTVQNFPDFSSDLPRAVGPGKHVCFPFQKSASVSRYQDLNGSTNSCSSVWLRIPHSFVRRFRVVKHSWNTIVQFPFPE